MTGSCVIDEAVAVLRRGGLVAFPTETVYGLGSDATNPIALRHLYAVKRRPAGHPVIVHIGDPSQLSEWAASVPRSATALTEACWPGALTVIVRRHGRVPPEVTAGRDTVGLRVPDQPLARELLRAFGGGIAAPSANRFGRVSPTTAADVRADLGDDVDLVIDGGPCRVGVESTIVDCTVDPPVIARRGGVTQAQVEAIVGEAVAVSDRGAIAAPGTLDSHYAPRARVHVVDVEMLGSRASALLASERRVALLAQHPPSGLPAAVLVLPPVESGATATDGARG